MRCFLALPSTLLPQKRSVEWEERVLFTLNMAALHPKARGNTSSSPTTTTTTITNNPTTNVAAVEAGVTNPMLTREKQPVLETNDTASDPLRDNNRVTDVARIVVAGADQGFQGDTVEGKASAAGAADGAVPATPVETDASTSRYGPTPPRGSARKGRDGEGGDCVVSDCRDEGLTSDSDTPRRVADGQNADGLPAEKEGGDEGQEQPAPPQAAFVLVAKEHLVGTWLAVFVRASMLTQVSDVRSGKHAYTKTHETNPRPWEGSGAADGMTCKLSGLLTSRESLDWPTVVDSRPPPPPACPLRSAPKMDRCHYLAALWGGAMYRPLPLFHRCMGLLGRGSTMICGPLPSLHRYTAPTMGRVPSLHRYTGRGSIQTAPVTSPLYGTIWDGAVL